MATHSTLRRPRVVIVMGVTGVGKGTFVEAATGLNVEIGHSHNACTSKVALFPIAGESTVLADTPGFDDTFRNDADILQDLNDCLSEAYHEHWEIAGVLYIHPITEVRMKGSAMKNLEIFREVLGTRNMSNCILVTTKWSLQDKPTAEARERELVESRLFWKPLIDRGATTKRFADSKDSALDILHQLTRKAPIIPKITHETQELRTSLANTSAARVVDQDIRQAQEQHLRELQRLKAQQEIAIIEKDKAYAEDLEIERKKTADVLKQLADQRAVLQTEPRRGSAGIRIFFASTVGSALIFGSIAATILTEGLAAPLIPAALGASARMMDEATEP